MLLEISPANRHTNQIPTQVLQTARCIECARHVENGGVSVSILVSILRMEGMYNEGEWARSKVCVCVIGSFCAMQLSIFGHCGCCHLDTVSRQLVAEFLPNAPTRDHHHNLAFLLP